MKVKVIKLGHCSVSVDVPEGSHVEEVLEQAGVLYEKCSLQLDGVTTNSDAEVDGEDRVLTITPKVEGGIL